MADRYPEDMDKTPEQPRPRWVQVLGKAALAAFPVALVLGLVLDATDPPEWVSSVAAVAYAAIVVVATLVALWLVVRAEDEGGPSGP
jgi:hypothetical protein